MNQTAKDAVAAARASQLTAGGRGRGVGRGRERGRGGSGVGGRGGGVVQDPTLPLSLT